MKNKSWLSNLIVVLIVILAGIFAFPHVVNVLFHEPSAEAEDTHDFKRGPHGGRLLNSDHLEVEVTIFEPEGVPPKFRIYFYENGVSIKPSEVNYEMILERINRTENIPFQEHADYLESTVEASEPHSFKVKIQAKFKGKIYDWEYESYEGRVELTPEAIQANSIRIETAKAMLLDIQLNVMGKIVPNDEVTVHISPRFPGIVKSVNKKLGDRVQKGEILAVIESNESLRNYEIKSEMDGIIIKRDINLGMYLTGQENIFVISDLRTVWADFTIYRHDLSQIKIGDAVEISSLDGILKAQSTISYISPFGNESTQSVIARAIISNSDEAWKPGLFISGTIISETLFIPIAVKDAALQTFRDWDVVFISSGNVFEVAPVKLGRKNNEWVEVISGLLAGDPYVSENSFILKADLEKSGATHEH